jgi:ADP-ribosylglycohydrolase
MRDMNDKRRDRAIGALVGLAVGDSIGTSLEFSERDSRPPVNDMVGGGPFRLRPGEWTDDTAMALCLADSLLACDGLDQRDLIERFCQWWRNGENSCTGDCFDVGITTREALWHFENTGDPIAGGTEPHKAGNGSLMRLAITKELEVSLGSALEAGVRLPRIEECLGEHPALVAIQADRLHFLDGAHGRVMYAGDHEIGERAPLQLGGALE